MVAIGIILAPLVLCVNNAQSPSTGPALRATGPVPRTEVKRAASAITVDGKLDEAAWEAAVRLEFVFPWEKQTGAKETTVARLLWDDRALYVAYECEDADIIAHHLNHDDPTYEDDCVEIFINPDPTQSFYFGLEMNARGVLYDYFYPYPKPLIRRFDLAGAQVAAYARGTINQPGDRDRGWSLEVAIPWANFSDLAKTLPPPPGTVWKVNLNRWDNTTSGRRLSQWSDSGLDIPNPHLPERFGEIVFVESRRK